MGCISSTQISGDAKNLKQRDDEINKRLRAESSNRANVIKLLLLGAGESGKSTLAKQMKIIHNNGYTKGELENFKKVIRENILFFVAGIVKAIEVNHENKLDSSTVNVAHQLQKLKEDECDNAINKEEFWTLAKKLWTDPNVKNLAEDAEVMQINRSTMVLMDDLERIQDKDYLPTEKDVLYSRSKTSGIVESVFSDGKHTFKLYDVGGQRSERRKWIHCFDSVNGLIFVSSLAEYNLKLVEDESESRMMESLKLFESTCNSPWFSKSSIILFLNKKDIFSEKIKKYPLSLCFPDYKGENTFEQASEYIKKKFIQRSKAPERDIYVHLTCATDTKSVTFVFTATKDVIIKTALKEYGFY